MTVTYDVFEIDNPITSISYIDDYGYYVDAKDVKDIIKSYVEAEEYDHIFIAYKLGEVLHEERIRTGDWVGLGGMTYEDDIGYSNIRVPNEKATLLYKYSTYNTFPEEVFVHEFLHGLERIEAEYGNDVIELHSYADYGYKKDDVTGLKYWYRDYLQGKVSSRGLGLSKEVFIRKPIQDSDYRITVDLTEEYFYEPHNLKEEIIDFINKIKNYIDNNNNNDSNNIKVEENSESIRV